MRAWPTEECHKHTLWESDEPCSEVTEASREPFTKGTRLRRIIKSDGRQGKELKRLLISQIKDLLKPPMEDDDKSP